MPLTLNQLSDAGFAQEDFPSDLPAPGPETLSSQALEGSHELFRYDAVIQGTPYAMEIVVDRATIENPAEGVNFMLNQFAYLWRMDRAKIAVAADGTCRRIHF